MTAKSLVRPITLTIPTTVLTIGVAVLLPYLIHFLPNSGTVPMGARLLPIFVAPLVAILLNYPTAGVMTSLFAPYLSRLLTNSPATEELTILLTLELTVFSLVVLLLRPYLLRARSWGFFVSSVGPMAYLVAKGVEYLFLLAQPDFIVPPAREYVQNSTENALPGIMILLVTSIVVVMYVKRQKAANRN